MAAASAFKTLINTDTVSAYAESILALGQHPHVDSLPRVEIALPGLSLRVKIEPGELSAALQQTIVPAARVSHLEHRSSEITILHAGMPGIPAPVPWGNGPYFPHDVATMLAEKRLSGTYFYDDCLWQIYAIDDAFGVQLMKGSTTYPGWELGAPLRVFLHWHYANRGMRLVHGGTLAINDTGILLAGAGGAGKSGTVVAGLLHGLNSVGDDYVLVDPANGIKAYPIYSTLKQDPAGFKRMRLEERLGVRPLNWQGKHEFRIQDLSQQALAGAIDLKAIIIPRIGAASTTFRKATGREAMMALAPSALHQMPGERHSGFRFFSTLVQSLPAYFMDLGSDPAEIAVSVRHFIEDLTR